MENLNELWQVEVGGQVYEAPLAELPEWIDEGSLQPGDKVRKGNLRWIEARKVPSLVPFFNARASGEAMPFVQSVTVAEEAEASSVKESPVVGELEPATGLSHSEKGSVSAAKPGYCFGHPDESSVFVCSGCSRGFCKACPRTYSSVRICPECGSMCRSENETAAAAKKAGIAASADGPFGLADLGRAFAHPFAFKSSLLFGGLMFMFFTLGQSAAAMGGIFLIAGAVFCVMLSNMLTFGVLANTVDNFTQGRLDADFMPSFEDFSAWDDVIHPFFLSIGVYITSFGPFVLTAIVGAYLIMSAAGEQMQKYNEEISRLPGTAHYQPDRTVEQSQQVRELLEQVKAQNARRLARQQRLTETAEGVTTSPAAAENVPSGTDLAQEDLEARLQEVGAQRGSGSANAAEIPAQGSAAMVSNILRLAAPLVVIGGIALLWGLFYFPAACAVAGYTRSFAATINPLVGLDTIRRLGGTYVKLLIMGLLLIIVSGVAAAAVEIVLFPFHLPSVGNIPAKAVGALFTFYFSVVFSCLLGLALFKSADRLALSR